MEVNWIEVIRIRGDQVMINTYGKHLHISRVLTMGVYYVYVVCTMGSCSPVHP
jgi:hypothetical protein